MKLAIMQPYFFPYIGYFQLINYVDKFILYSKVNYIKGGFINRNSILDTNHISPFRINIPLINQSSNKLIEEILIAQGSNWKDHLSRTIKYTYNRAPYFAKVYPLIEKILYCNLNSIHEFNCYSIIEIAKYLEINTTISFYEQYFPTIEYQIGQRLHEDQNVPQKVQRIFLFCEFENASDYINPIGGKTIYDKQLFKDYGINLYFLNPTMSRYKQFKTDLFIQNLSIIDVLMFNTVSEINYMLSQFKLE